MEDIKISQQICNLEIDYTEVGGDPILPFLIELDLVASDLEPAPGDNQRFCYNLTGVGEDTSDFADLSHFVLSICDEIPEEQIVNVTVIIDGIEQDVTDENVELLPPSNPDPETGCPGLKFDFGLDKFEGEMTVCFELTETYPIGPIEVCLFGGGRAADGLSICGPVCEPIVVTCPAVAYQPLTVCVPVTITPFANALPTTTFCCGDPIITPGTGNCGGILNGNCTFTITQNICVSVPIEFGATSIVGNPFVQCEDATAEDVCSDCDPNPDNGVNAIRKNSCVITRKLVKKDSKFIK